MTIKDLLQTKELKIYVTFSLFLYIYKYYGHKNFFINQQISLKLGGNNMKKLVLFLLTSTLLISNISLVFAAETNESNTAANTHQSITIEKNGDFLTDQNKVTRGTSYPSRGWDLSNEDYTGSVQFRNNVITNYYFTGNTDSCRDQKVAGCVFFRRRTEFYTASASDRLCIQTGSVADFAADSIWSDNDIRRACQTNS